MTQEFNRRRFVGAAASVAAVAAAGPLLSAFGGGGGGGQNTGGNTKSGLKAALPAHVPRNAVKPDIAPVQGSEGAVTDPGFLRYPAERATTVDGVPGSGGKYTAVTPLWGTVPSPGNSFYQAMSNLNVGQLAGSQLTDLTPHLSGDKIKKYPNLAALPTDAWHVGAWRDKIYGIPCSASRFVVPGATFYRRDILGAKGITADQVKSAADLMSQGKELTDAKRGVWALDDVWTYYLYPLFGAAQKWQVEDDKLVHVFETPQYLEALDWHHKLANSGYMHPDAPAGDNAGSLTRFYSGEVLIQGGGTGAWSLADHESGQAANKNYRRGAFDVFAADGKSTTRTFMGASTSLVSYFNARLKPEQIEELGTVSCSRC